MALLGIGQNALERLEITKNQAYENKVKDIIKNNSENKQEIKDTETTSNTVTDTEDEVVIINNIMTTTNDELIKRYGIRQEIVIKSDKEDSNMKVARVLSEHCRPTEDLTIKCIGDLDYRVGFGVHFKSPFLPKYYDCLMYIKEVEHEWIGDIFTSTLTLTPSRVMDTQEWSDTTDSSDNEDNEKGSAGSDLWNRIYGLLKQQIGKPYVYASQDAPNSFDCSLLVQYCFNQFKDETGVTLGRDTYSQVKQGMEVDKSDKDSWSEGDLIFFTGKSTPPSHVAVYTGNGNMIEAPYTGEYVREIALTRNDIYAVRRVIPESVKVYDKINVDIPTEYLNKIKTGVESNVSTCINNMSKYGFKDKLISIAKQNNIDPYTVLGIITIESEGNPNCGTGIYKGLMQIQGSTDIESNLSQGCKEYNEMCGYCGYCSVHCALCFYNFGNGNAMNACKQAGVDYKTATIKQLGDACYNYAPKVGCDSSEKAYYPSKVLYAISLLRSKKVLG